MNIIEGSGHIVTMNATHPLHYRDERRTAESDDVAGSFADALNRAISRVNDLQVDSQDLTNRMIHEPESVNVHSVMIAAQKAEIALTFARSIRDEAIRTYRELMNLR